MKIHLKIDPAPGGEAMDVAKTKPGDLREIGEFIVELASAQALGNRGADYQIARLELEVTW